MEQLQEKFNELKSKVDNLCPELVEQLKKEEEERKKALEEANNLAKEVKPRKEREPRTKKQKIETAQTKKSQGNTFFVDGNYEDACRRYTQVIRKNAIHKNQK